MSARPVAVMRRVPPHPPGPEGPAGRRVPVWPVWVLAAPAAVSIWAGWVGLGTLTGFGVVQLLPGIWDSLRINTAMTLPIGMEAYAAYGLYVWLSGEAPRRAREFARISALAALVLGALGQVSFHLMAAAGVTAAPWPITAAVSCLPVGVLGMAATLAHLVRDGEPQDSAVAATRPPVADHPNATATHPGPPATDGAAQPGPIPPTQRPPGDPLAARVAAMVATSRDTGRPVGRRTVARQLGVSEHRASQLLAGLTTTTPAGTPGHNGAARKEGTR